LAQLAAIPTIRRKEIQFGGGNRKRQARKPKVQSQLKYFVEASALAFFPSVSLGMIKWGNGRGTMDSTFKSSLFLSENTMPEEGIFFLFKKWERL